MKQARGRRALAGNLSRLKEYGSTGLTGRRATLRGDSQPVAPAAAMPGGGLRLSNGREWWKMPRP